jgi:hypothetical protein
MGNPAHITLTGRTYGQSRRTSMVNWTDDQLFLQMPPSCRRALAPFNDPDLASARRQAWDHCQDAVALLWLAAVRAPEKEGADRRVVEEIERAKGRVLEPINEPSTELGRRAQDRLVNDLGQPRAVVDGSPAAADRLPEWSAALDERLPRELWVEYVRRMADVTEGIRMNLRDIVVD